MEHNMSDRVGLHWPLAPAAAGPHDRARPEALSPPGLPQKSPQRQDTTRCTDPPENSSPPRGDAATVCHNGRNAGMNVSRLLRAAMPVPPAGSSPPESPGRTGISMTPGFLNLRLLFLAAALVAMVVLFIHDMPPPVQGQTSTDLSALTAESSTDGNTFAAMTGADTLAPAFAAGTTGYRATVGHHVTHIRLTPTVAVSGSTLQVGKSGNLETVASGTASNGIALYVGDNEVIVRVTASDNTTQDYTVTVRRVPAGSVWWATLLPVDLAASHLRINGLGCVSDNDFNLKNRCSNTAVLTDGVLRHDGTENNVYQIRLSPALFSVSIQGVQTAATQALDFCVGPNPFDITATDVSTSSHSLTWTAGVPVSLSIGTACTASSDATLSGLTARSATSAVGAYGALTLTPSTFSPGITSYTASVPNATTHAKLTPTVNHASATVQVGRTGNLARVNSGTPSRAIALNVGANAITVRVTAQDTRTKDYTVTITRQRSTDATLSGLTATSCVDNIICSGTLDLSPDFGAGTTSYTATVPASRNHVKLTPTASHAAATVRAGKEMSLSPVTRGNATNAIALDLGDNAITVRVTAQAWPPPRTTRSPSPGGDGCPPPTGNPNSTSAGSDRGTSTGWAAGTASRAPSATPGTCSRRTSSPTPRSSTASPTPGPSGCRSSTAPPTGQRTGWSW